MSIVSLVDVNFEVQMIETETFGDADLYVGSVYENEGFDYLAKEHRHFKNNQLVYSLRHNDFQCIYFEGNSAVNQGFSYRIRVKTANTVLDMRKLLESNGLITVVYQIQDGVSSPVNRVRRISGSIASIKAVMDRRYLTQVEIDNYWLVYDIEIESTLARLKSSDEKRVFSNRNIHEIVSAIFAEAGFDSVSQKSMENVQHYRRHQDPTKGWSYDTELTPDDIIDNFRVFMNEKKFFMNGTISDKMESQLTPDEKALHRYRYPFVMQYNEDTLAFLQRVLSWEGYYMVSTTIQVDLPVRKRYPNGTDTGFDDRNGALETAPAFIEQIQILDSFSPSFSMPEEQNWDRMAQSGYMQNVDSTTGKDVPNSELELDYSSIALTYSLINYYKFDKKTVPGTFVFRKPNQQNKWKGSESIYMDTMFTDQMLIDKGTPASNLGFLTQLRNPSIQKKKIESAHILNMQDGIETNKGFGFREEILSRLLKAYDYEGEKEIYLHTASPMFELNKCCKIKFYGSKKYAVLGIKEAARSPRFGTLVQEEGISFGLLGYSAEVLTKAANNGLQYYPIPIETPTAPSFLHGSIAHPNHDIGSLYGVTAVQSLFETPDPTQAARKLNADPDDITLSETLFDYSTSPPYESYDYPILLEGGRYEVRFSCNRSSFGIPYDLRQNASTPLALLTTNKKPIKKVTSLGDNNTPEDIVSMSIDSTVNYSLRPGTQVLVGFMNGNMSYPVIIGTLSDITKNSAYWADPLSKMSTFENDPQDVVWRLMEELAFPYYMEAKDKLLSTEKEDKEEDKEDVILEEDQEDIIVEEETKEDEENEENESEDDVFYINKDELEYQKIKTVLTESSTTYAQNSNLYASDLMPADLEKFKDIVEKSRFNVLGLDYKQMYEDYVIRKNTHSSIQHTSYVFMGSSPVTQYKTFKKTTIDQKTYNDLITQQNSEIYGNNIDRLLQQYKDHLTDKKLAEEQEDASEEAFDVSEETVEKQKTAPQLSNLQLEQYLSKSYSQDPELAYGFSNVSHGWNAYMFPMAKQGQANVLVEGSGIVMCDKLGQESITITCSDETTHVTLGRDFWNGAHRDYIFESTRGAYHENLHSGAQYIRISKLALNDLVEQNIQERLKKEEEWEAKQQEAEKKGETIPPLAPEVQNDRPDQLESWNAVKKDLFKFPLYSKLPKGDRLLGLKYSEIESFDPVVGELSGEYITSREIGLKQTVCAGDLSSYYYGKTARHIHYGSQVKHYCLPHEPQTNVPVQDLFDVTNFLLSKSFIPKMMDSLEGDTYKKNPNLSWKRGQSLLNEDDFYALKLDRVDREDEKFLSLSRGKEITPPDELMDYYINLKERSLIWNLLVDYYDQVYKIPTGVMSYMDPGNVIFAMAMKTSDVMKYPLQGLGYHAMLQFKIRGHHDSLHRPMDGWDIDVSKKWDMKTEQTALMHRVFGNPHGAITNDRGNLEKTLVGYETEKSKRSSFKAIGRDGINIYNYKREQIESTAGFLIGGDHQKFQDIQNLKGSFEIKIDSDSHFYQGGAIFQPTKSFQEVAAVLQKTVLKDKAGVSYDGVVGKFKITSKTKGKSSTISLATGPIASGLGLASSNGALVVDGVDNPWAYRHDGVKQGSIYSFEDPINWKNNKLPLINAENASTDPFIKTQEFIQDKTSIQIQGEALDTIKHSTTMSFVDYYRLSGFYVNTPATGLGFSRDSMISFLQTKEYLNASIEFFWPFTMEAKKEEQDYRLALMLEVWAINDKKNVYQNMQRDTVYAPGHIDPNKRQVYNLLSMTGLDLEGLPLDNKVYFDLGVGKKHDSISRDSNWKYYTTGFNFFMDNMETRAFLVGVTKLFSQFSVPRSLPVNQDYSDKLRESTSSLLNGCTKSAKALFESLDSGLENTIKIKELWLMSEEEIDAKIKKSSYFFILDIVDDLKDHFYSIISETDANKSVNDLWIDVSQHNNWHVTYIYSFLQIVKDLDKEKGTTILYDSLIKATSVFAKILADFYEDIKANDEIK